jgi:hypothetical protein
MPVPPNRDIGWPSVYSRLVSPTGTQSMWIEKAMLAFICIAVVLAVWQVFAK